MQNNNGSKRDIRAELIAKGIITPGVHGVKTTQCATCEDKFDQLLDRSATICPNCEEDERRSRFHRRRSHDSN